MGAARAGPRRPCGLAPPCWECEWPWLLHACCMRLVSERAHLSSQAQASSHSQEKRPTPSHPHDSSHPHASSPAQTGDTASAAGRADRVGCGEAVVCTCSRIVARPDDRLHEPLHQASPTTPGQPTSAGFVRNDWLVNPTWDMGRQVEGGGCDQCAHERKRKPAYRHRSSYCVPTRRSSRRHSDPAKQHGRQVTKDHTRPIARCSRPCRESIQAV